MPHAGWMRFRLPLAMLAIALSSSPLLAHDLWIEPTTFAPEPGQWVGVRLRVGQDLLGDPLPRHAALIDRFVFEDATGRKPVVGQDGVDPAGLLRVEPPGLLVIGYHSHPSAVELPSEKFNRYLREEGLETIAALRARDHETETSARELFSRCAKSLVLSGAPSTAQSDRPLGFTLELVAERNPYVLGTDEELPVRLIYQERPLADALVVAMNRLHPAEKLAARTDAAGRVRFRLRPEGMWLIKAVHMVPAAADSQAKWASFWASLTFERPSKIAQSHKG